VLPGKAVRTAEALNRQIEGADCRPVRWSQMNGHAQRAEQKVLIFGRDK